MTKKSLIYCTIIIVLVVLGIKVMSTKEDPDVSAPITLEPAQEEVKVSEKKEIETLTTKETDTNTVSNNGPTEPEEEMPEEGKSGFQIELDKNDEYQTFAPKETDINQKIELTEEEKIELLKMVEKGEKIVNMKALLASQQGMDLLKKYNIDVEKDTAPSVNPLWIRNLLKEYIIDDFDNNFLLSVGLKIYADQDDDYSLAEFENEYTYTNPRTGKPKTGKTIYRAFKIYNVEAIIDELQVENDEDRLIYQSLDSLETDKFIAYTSKLRDTMQKEHRYSEKEWNQLYQNEHKRWLEKQKQKYLKMVQDFDLNQKVLQTK